MLPSFFRVVVKRSFAAPLDFPWFMVDKKGDVKMRVRYEGEKDP